MNDSRYQQARHYALGRLENELPPQLVYHSIAHTRDDVVPAAARLAGLVGIKRHEMILLLTAAWFHDLGFIFQREENEWIAAEIACDVLPGFGFTPDEVTVISRMILATRLPQSPSTPLESLLADADLDSLGRPDFFHISQKLRDELANFGVIKDDPVWYRYQIAFIRTHRYFTPAACLLREGMKRRNLSVLMRLLAQNQ